MFKSVVYIYIYRYIHLLRWSYINFDKFIIGQSKKSPSQNRFQNKTLAFNYCLQNTWTYAYRYMGRVMGTGARKCMPIINVGMRVLIKEIKDLFFIFFTQWSSLIWCLYLFINIYTFCEFLFPIIRTEIITMKL